MSTRQHIERVLVSRSQAKLAKDAGCSQQYISWLINRGGRVSAEMALAFERATEGEVTRYQLRPDIFGPAPAGAAA